MDDLAAAVREGKIILFVGAGVSMNLGLPSSWQALIDRIAEDLGYKPQDYKKLGEFYALAEYYRITKGDFGQLRSWMDEHWHPDDVRIESSAIHRLICSLDFPLIYTTNYDKWLERAFDHYGKRYVKISTMADLLKVPCGKTQIVKFHGDIEDEDSMVLDESSYFQRLEFETPLDIKLRADVLSRGVLFIGYGLSDVNLRFMFYKLSRIWQNSRRAGDRPASYIFSPQPNAVQEAIFGQWGIQMITAADGADPAQALESFLQDLLRRRDGGGPDTQGGTRGGARGPAGAKPGPRQAG